MNYLSRWLLPAVIFFGATRAVASEEDFVPWSEVTISNSAPQESERVILEAKRSDAGFASFRIRAFGRVFVLTAGDLAKIRDIELSGLSITQEAGYKELGGRTVHVRLKQARYLDGVLTNERATISVSIDGRIVVSVERKKA